MKNRNKFKLLIVALLIIITSAVNTTITKATNLNVNSEEPPTATSKDKRIMYLTFDDGPSTVITSKVLDILKEENVKATFFVVGYKIEGREDLIRRIYKEGHTIGLHSFTHHYKQIYSSDNAFIAEMDKTRAEINKILGFEPNIIRFPSGSKPHLSKSLLEKLHEKNYKIYDWNLSLSDGLDYNTSTDKLYREAISKCVNPNKIFFLAHCDQPNKNTCTVLPKIIKHYKDLGYEFKAITDATPEYHFKVSK